MKTHVLKCLKEYFCIKWDGNKKWELRKNDRDFKIGDLIIEEEGVIENDIWKPTSRKIIEQVTWILKDAEQFGLMKGYCIVSTKIIKKLSWTEDNLPI